MELLHEIVTIATNNDAMFSFDKMPQAKFKSKGAIIAEQILLQIKSGEYPAGSKLPAERLIAEQIGVSRPSVREAISALANCWNH